MSIRIPSKKICVDQGWVLESKKLRFSAKVDFSNFGRFGRINEFRDVNNSNPRTILARERSSDMQNWPLTGCRGRNLGNREFHGLGHVESPLFVEKSTLSLCCAQLFKDSHGL